MFITPADRDEFENINSKTIAEITQRTVLIGTILDDQLRMDFDTEFREQFSERKRRPLRSEFLDF